MKYFLLGFFLTLICCSVFAVDMSIIATIESSNNPAAYNERTNATGLYQITPICRHGDNSIDKFHGQFIEFSIFVMSYGINVCPNI